MSVKETVLRTLYKAEKGYWDTLTLREETDNALFCDHVVTQIGIGLPELFKQTDIRTTAQDEQLITDISLTMENREGQNFPVRIFQRCCEKAMSIPTCTITPDIDENLELSTYSARIAHYPHSYPFLIHYFSVHESSKTLLTMFLYSTSQEFQYKNTILLPDRLISSSDDRSVIEFQSLGRMYQFAEYQLPFSDSQATFISYIRIDPFYFKSHHNGKKNIGVEFWNDLSLSPNGLHL